MVKKTLKIMGLTILGVVLLVAVSGVFMVSCSPQFGALPTKVEREAYSETEHYEDGKFQNEMPTNLAMSFKDITSTLGSFIKGVPRSEPDFELPIKLVDSLNLTKNKTETKLIWFGHSAFLLQINGLNVLIDPMLSDVPSPYTWLGKGRYSKELPIDIEKLPNIDIMIISHDHYDHLDYLSILQLKEKTKAFFVPLGVAAHLRRWDVDPKKVTELDWWDEAEYAGLKLVFAPSRHFSGRGFGDRFTTLWGSWIIKNNKHNIYFSGDGGYGPHFKKIGERYGPFDFAMMECGQYNEKWREIHMMPEETAQAAADVKAKTMMPIHWGAFTLSLHSWNEPPQRVVEAAKELNIPLITPYIGEAISLDKVEDLMLDKWWDK